MKKLYYLILPVVVIAALSNTARAETIYQCEQPDGTIEFSNQGCSKSSKLERKKSYKHKKLYNIKKSRSSSRLNISSLQKRILQTSSADELEKYAREIIDKVHSTAQKGQLRIACNAIASTYAKLTRQQQRQKRQGKAVPLSSANIQMLFEEIMLAEAMINTANELEREISLAWEKYHRNSLETAQLSRPD